MKILLVGFAKIKYMPYANFYLDNIDKQRNDVHFVYWNRDLQPEDTAKYADVTLHEFRRYQEDNVSKKRKIASFLKYRRYVRQLLKQETFDFVIVLHSMAGIILQDVWNRKFKDRFIFDYRDSTYEKRAWFKRMIAGLIRNSKVTFTSSDGFRIYFPQDQQHKIHTTHNLLMDSLCHRDLPHHDSGKLRVSFWGLVREGATEREIISKFAADPRFELHYYGREQAVAKALKAYAKEIRAENVFFHGEYKPEQRYDFAANTELIHNIYRTGNMMLAMSNKYYDGGLFYIPQLCMQDSVMGKMAEKSGIGFACDPWAEDFTERVYRYYTGIDKKTFACACDAEVERVTEEYRKATAMIAECVG